MWLPQSHVLMVVAETPAKDSVNHRPAVRFESDFNWRRDETPVSLPETEYRVIHGNPISSHDCCRPLASGRRSRPTTAVQDEIVVNIEANQNHQVRRWGEKDTVLVVVHDIFITEYPLYYCSFTNTWAMSSAAKA